MASNTTLLFESFPELPTDFLQAYLITNIPIIKDKRIAL